MLNRFKNYLNLSIIKIRFFNSLFYCDSSIKVGDFVIFKRPIIVKESFIVVDVNFALKMVVLINNNYFQNNQILNKDLLCLPPCFVSCLWDVVKIY